jgi:SNF2 family DNA or RNA helicase
MVARGAPGGTDDASLARLRRGLAPFLLRRTKEQVLTELPRKTEQTIYCELTPRERKRYDALRNHYRALVAGLVDRVGFARSRIQILEALLRLRQAACHYGLVNRMEEAAGSSKLDTLVESLRELIAEGHKALVFSQFTSLLALVRRRLELEGWSYQYLDGRTRNRAEVVDQFQANSDSSIFLISLKAGGVGLNLTAADYVFILDPWWNPAVEMQAIDRAHRIGQERPVFAYRLIAKDTIEERIVTLQADKRRLADAIIGEDRGLMKSMTVEDLELLLS